jgi:hypothetical protein
MANPHKASCESEQTRGEQLVGIAFWAGLGLVVFYVGWLMGRLDERRGV